MISALHISVQLAICRYHICSPYPVKSCIGSLRSSNAWILVKGCCRLQNFFEIRKEEVGKRRSVSIDVRQLILIYQCIERTQLIQDV
jgi:hypothetical protein